MNTVTIKNRDIWSVIPNQRTPMMQAFADLAELQIGRRAGLTMARIARTLMQQQEDINTQRMAIVEKFSEKDEESGETIVNEEGEAAFLDILSNGTFEVERILVSEIHNPDQVKPLIWIGLGELLVDDLTPTENGNTPKAAAAAKRRRR